MLISKHTGGLEVRGTTLEGLELYTLETSVTASTVGATWDALVVKAEEVCLDLNLWALLNRSESYDFSSEYWTVNYRWPSILYPAKQNLDVQANARLLSAEGLAMSAVEHRHRQIESFFSLITLYRQYGFFGQRRPVFTMAPPLSVEELRFSEHLPDYKHFGHSGVYLDATIQALGRDYKRLAKAYAKAQGEASSRLNN